MRLVIHSQGAAEAGLRRYNGRGIFSLIGRKLFSFGLKKVINAVEKENHPQTIADAVVNGSRPIDKTSKKFRKENIVKLQRTRVKRKKSTPPTSPSSSKVRKYSENTANKLINSGSGIVLD